jgi:hypothetical protein
MSMPRNLYGLIHLSYHQILMTVPSFHTSHYTVNSVQSSLWEIACTGLEVRFECIAEVIKLIHSTVVLV